MKERDSLLVTRESDSPDVSRRDAIKSFALVGVASTLGVSPDQLERAINGVSSLNESRVTPPESQQPAYTPRFFTAHEWRTVRTLVDYIIPRDARSGSATDARVPEFMDWLLADSEASENSRVSMRGGLGWMDRESRDRFNSTFVAATDAQRRQVLDDIAWPSRARPEMSQGVAFFNRMRDFTASGFWSSQIGWRDLGYTGNAFARWDGCPPAVLEKLGVSYDLMNGRTGQ